MGARGARRVTPRELPACLLPLGVQMYWRKAGLCQLPRTWMDGWMDGWRKAGLCQLHRTWMDGWMEEGGAVPAAQDLDGGWMNLPSLAGFHLGGGGGGGGGAFSPSWNAFAPPWKSCGHTSLTMMPPLSIQNSIFAPPFGNFLNETLPSSAAMVAAPILKL